MTKQAQNIKIQVQTTPNPHSMKFVLNQKVAEEHWEVDNQAQAGRSPLAQKIMGFPWVDKVFIGPDFITISKQDWVEWETLTDPLSDMIGEHIESGQAVIYPLAEMAQQADFSSANERASAPANKGMNDASNASAPANKGMNDTSFGKKDTHDQTHSELNQEDSDTVQQIKHILETEIQPAVAMDGGFIAFAGYKDGRVFLKMQGACSGCPSATITLKQGIETHLKNRLPVVKEVIAT